MPGYGDQCSDHSGHYAGVYGKDDPDCCPKSAGRLYLKHFSKKLDAVDPEDKDAVLDLGIDFAVEQCRGLLEKGVPGLHFYTMDRLKSTTEIIGRLKSENLLN